MAGIDIVALRAAVKTQLDNANLTIDVAAGVSRKVAVYDYMSDANGLQYPCIVIKHMPGEIDYMVTLGSAGVSKVTLGLEVRCAATDGRSAEMALDLLLGAGVGVTNSVFNAMFADPTIGGNVSDGTALTASAPAPFTDGTTTYWLSTFTLNVYARKDRP